MDLKHNELVVLEFIRLMRVFDVSVTISLEDRKVVICDQDDILLSLQIPPDGVLKITPDVFREVLEHHRGHALPELPNLNLN